MTTGIRIFLSIIVLLGTNLDAIAQETIPLKRTLLSNGIGRYSIPIVLDGRKIDGMLDTGSVGLRYLDLDGKAKGQIHQAGFASGVVYGGGIINQNLSIGSANSVVPSQDVVKVSCDNHHPECPAKILSPGVYRIGGMGLAKEGFEAIIGIAPELKHDEWVNPLVTVADSWVLELPRPTDDASGYVLLNPTAIQQSQYADVQRPKNVNGLGDSFRAAIDGCVEADGVKSLCGPISLDTGSVGVEVSGPGATAISGKNVRIHFHMADKTELVISSKDVAHGAPAGRVSGFDAKRTTIAAGVLPYFALSVLYDSKHDRLAIKMR